MEKWGSRGRINNGDNPGQIVYFDGAKKRKIKRVLERKIHRELERKRVRDHSVYVCGCVYVSVYV